MRARLGQPAKSADIVKHPVRPCVHARGEAAYPPSLPPAKLYSTFSLLAAKAGAIVVRNPIAANKITISRVRAFLRSIDASSKLGGLQAGLSFRQEKLPGR
jgi:hypothetical protein